MFNELQNEEINSVISSQLIGRLGCYADEIIYIVPISYAYNGDFLYCRSHEGMKIKMMRKNPHVCFQVDDTRNLSNWKSVICWGEFEELYENDARQEAIQCLSSRKLPSISSQTMHLTNTWPFRPEDPTEVKGILFRIKLTKKTGKCEITSSQLFVGT